MASKDQALGWLVFVACVAVAVWYTVTLVFPSVVFGWMSPRDVQMWLIGVPVFVAFIGVLAIGEWVGWIMATTPPPKPVEEIEEKEETTKNKA